MGHLRRMAKRAFSSAATYLMSDKEGLITLSTRRGPAKGLRFGLKLKSPALEYAYWFGTYDRSILEALSRVCQPGWTVWDCGTYLGYYTCFFSRLVGPAGRVIAFEPDPANLDRTRRNVARNGFENVSFQECAIGGVTKEIDFVLSRNTNSHMPGLYVGATRQDYARIERRDTVARVQCTTLDDACFTQDLPRPDLIKIDIEGAEQFALEHILRICQDVRPIIVLELHNPECDRAAWEWGQRQKYSLWSLNFGRLFDRAEDVCGTLLCFPADLRCNSQFNGVESIGVLHDSEKNSDNAQ